MVAISGKLVGLAKELDNFIVVNSISIFLPVYELNFDYFFIVFVNALFILFWA